MPASEEQKKEALVLAEKIREEKVRCYDRMSDLRRMGAENLRHAGHASTETAIIWTLDERQKTIDRLMRDFLRKYPD